MRVVDEQQRAGASSAQADSRLSVAAPIANRSPAVAGASASAPASAAACGAGMRSRCRQRRAQQLGQARERDLAPRPRSPARAARASRPPAARRSRAARVLPIPGSPTSASTPLCPRRASARSRSSASRSSLRPSSIGAILGAPLMRARWAARTVAAIDQKEATWPPPSSPSRSTATSSTSSSSAPSTRSARPSTPRSSSWATSSASTARMAGAGSLTPVELARRSGVSERYVREWLNAQAAGGYVEYDPAGGGYTLPPEQTVALTDEESPAYLPGFFQIALGTRDRLAAHHRGGAQRRGRRLARAQPRRLRGLRALLPPRLQRRAGARLAAGARRRRREARGRASRWPTSAAATGRRRS